MSRDDLMSRSWRNARWALLVIALALFIGMSGYVYFGEGVTWAKAFADAAMILSGQGPLDQMKTPAGNIFEGTYALVSGFLFFAITGFALAPSLHFILKRFHLEDDEQAKRRSRN